MPSLCYKFHMPKLMPILEKNNEFHDHLKRIAGRMDINIKSLRISRKQLSHFLRERYKRTLAERILGFIEKNYQKILNIDAMAYIAVLDQFLQAGMHTHLRFCFHLFDLSNKGNVSE